MNEQAGKLLAFALLPMIGSGALASDGDGGAQAEVSGYIAAGVDHYGAFHDEDGEESTTRGVLRNAKLQVELAWGDAWEAEIDGGYEIEGDNKDAELGDAYVQYNGPDRLAVRLGQFKEPFGMERLTSYSSLGTGERSMATSAFAPGRSLGIMVGQYRKSSTWALGIFSDERKPEDGSAVTARVSRAPVRSEDQVLHLGAAASWRQHREEEFQIKDEAEVFSADNVVRSPRFEARESRLAGVEAGWQFHRLTVTAEVMAQEVRRKGGEWWRFTGGYVQAGLLLTDDQRPYERGEFKRIKPKSNGGALELVARYSAVDLRDRSIGAEASVTTVGLNYYLGKDIQLRLNYLMPEISGNRLSPDPGGNAATLRLVYRF